jgi:alkanesulfonate monooxygenase SsuD/methylene tetrahydromethanopterin reductase-like flavin-dependent oxidoreductase (luciferase family)
VAERLQLGLTPWQLQPTLSADTLCRQAELAEQWGYHSFFLPESHFSTAMPVPDPLLLLAAIAARTQRIKLGTTSWLLPIRQPLLAAEQAAALDQLSEGRLILGLGRGYQASMLQTFGVDLREKRVRFEEILTQMISAWKGEPLGGPEHALELVPRPVQLPHPPLWVAAFGPKAIDQVGGLGLPYLASPMESFDELEANQRRHLEAVAGAGLPAPDAVPIMRTVFISSDANRCAEIREQMVDSPARDWCMVGSREQLLDQISHYRESLAMTHLIAVRPRVRGMQDSENRASFEQLVELVGEDSKQG